MKKKWVLKSTIFFSILFTSLGCSNPNGNGVYAMLPGFGSTYDVRLYKGDKNHLSFISDLINHYNELCDKTEHKNKTNLYDINHANGEKIIVSKDLFLLIKKADELSKMTHGYFNPLVGKVADLWKKSLLNATIPDEKQIKTLIDEVQNSQLILDESECSIQIIGGAQLDFGGVGKGYVNDQILSYLKQENIHEYLINGGESSLMLGSRLDSMDFRVGIKGVEKIENYHKYQACFYDKNTLISSSSIFEQLTEINGEKYSHIYNPFTGSAQTKYDLVLIKGGTCDGATQDVLTTAFSHMELSDILTYTNKYDLDLFIYDDNQIVYQSEGMNIKYEKVS